jgi:hypothetical protein
MLVIQNAAMRKMAKMTPRMMRMSMGAWEFGVGVRRFESRGRSG